MIEEGLSSIHPKRSNEGLLKETQNNHFSFGNRSPMVAKESVPKPIGKLSHPKNSLSPF